MKLKIIYTLLIVLAGISVTYSQQIDSIQAFSGNTDQAYTPLSLVFTSLNMNDRNILSVNDSTSSAKLVPLKEKSSFFKDSIYIIGTAAVAAIIYFLWPEDNPPAQKKLTFGTPPPPR